MSQGKYARSDNGSSFRLFGRTKGMPSTIALVLSMALSFGLCARFAVASVTTIAELESPTIVQESWPESDKVEFASFRDQLTRNYDPGSTHTCASELQESQFQVGVEEGIQYRNSILTNVQKEYVDQNALEQMLWHLLYSEELLDQAEAYASVALINLLVDADSRWSSFAMELKQDIETIAARAAETNRRERILERVISHVRLASPEAWYEPGLLAALRERDALSEPVVAIYQELTEHHEKDLIWYGKLKGAIRVTLERQFQVHE